MAEPEDLVVEFAHRGVVAARSLWLRHHPAADTAARELAGLRPHLELLLAGLAERQPALLPAEPPAPPSWVARLLRPVPSHLRREPPPAATDGVSIQLPRTLPAALCHAGLTPAAAYRLLLVEQVARLLRATAAHAPGHPASWLQARYELAEAVAADGWIAVTFPGLLPDLLAARAAALAVRPPLAELRPMERDLERLLRAVLATSPLEPPGDVPTPATPMEARRWAEAGLAALRAEPRGFRGLPIVAVWGRSLPLRSPAGVTPMRAGEVPLPSPAPGRTRELRRSPEPREAKRDEDEGPMGTWIIRPDEPQESVEDPFGVRRPADRDDEAAPDDLADALADLPETRVVTSPEPAREVLAAETPTPRGVRPAAAPPDECGVVYPEWDYRIGLYRLRGAVVRELPVEPGDGAWAAAALARHAALVRRVRRQFAQLRPRRVRLRRQPDGGDLDLEAWVETWADRRAGAGAAGGEDRLYLAQRAARRSLAIAVMIDVSASTDGWIAGSRRVIDVEKEALLVVSEALDRLGDRHAIFAFSGEGPSGVRVQVVRDFIDRAGSVVARRIERLEPDRYTRVGAAVRHVTARLTAEPAERRLLLLLTDGRPNDIDQYEGRYGVEDTRQAVREAAREGVLTYGLTVDRSAPAYLGSMFGPGRAALLRRPERLPAALVEVLRRLTQGSG